MRGINQNKIVVNEKVQPELSLPLSREDMWEMLQEGLMEFALEAGLTLARQVIEEEVQQLAGSKGSRGAAAYRHGSQRGFMVMAGQKFPLERPRVRSRDGAEEVPLKSYENLRHAGAMPKAVLKKMALSVSSRDYEQAIELGRQGFGVKRSSVSRAFVVAASKALEELRGRRFDGVRFVAILLDGKQFAGEQIVAALGIKETGEKTLLGVIQGTTENAVVVGDLLSDLEERGFSREHPILAVVDSSKALTKGLKNFFGDNLFLQRCQLHKMRNVESYLSKDHWRSIKSKLQEAYRQNHEEQVRERLLKIRKELELMNPDAARSLDEGLEETLTVYKLGLSGELKRSLSSTNLIESAFSVTEDFCSNVKRWRGGDMRLRWCASGLLQAETKFRKIRGYSELPKLLSALDRAAGVDQKREAA